MTTVHIRNEVHDFVSWKEAFDKFDRFRADHGVRSYRVFRDADDEHQVDVALEFETTNEARSFCERLENIWATPQSRAQLVSHEDPVVLEVVEQRILQNDRLTFS